MSVRAGAGGGGTRAEVASPTMTGDLIGVVRNAFEARHRLFDQPRGGWAQSLLLAAIALVVLISVDASRVSAVPDPPLPGTPTGARWVLALALYATVALMGVLPASGGILFLADAAVLELASGRVPGSSLQLWIIPVGACAVIVLWWARGWVGWAVAAAVTGPLVGAWHVIAYTENLATLPVALGSIAASMALGLVLNRHRLDAIQLAQQSSDAAQRVHHEMIDILHDTVAADLARVVVTADALEAVGEDVRVREQARTLAETSRQAMRRLRELMDSDPGVRSRRSELPSQAIGSCRSMLVARGITLEVEGPEGCEMPDGSEVLGSIDACGSIQTRELVATVIREGATNILKHAPAGVTATLSIEMSAPDAPASTITISMANPINPDRAGVEADGARGAGRGRHAGRGSSTASDAAVGAGVPIVDDGLSGGLGLALLARRLNDAGGRVQYGASGALWVLVATIPARQR